MRFLADESCDFIVVKALRAVGQNVSATSKSTLGGNVGILEQGSLMSTKSIAVPNAIYERVQEIAAAEGKTVEQLATQAIERDLARRWLDRVGREGDLRRGNMSDAEVEALVERAVQEFRARS